MTGPVDNRQQRQLYRQAFTENAAPKLLIDPKDGAIVDANPAAQAFYGYRLEEFYALTIHDINTASLSEVQAEMARAQAEERRYFLFSHRVRSGQVHDVEVFSGPLDIDGYRYLYSIIHDITELRRHQRELEVYRDLFRSVPVGLYRNTPGPEGRFLHVNPAMVSIFEAESAEELLATPVRDLYIDPDQREEVSDLIEREGRVNGFELAMQSLRGRELRVSLSVRASRDEQGNRVFDGFVEDITARRRSEAERDRMRELLHGRVLAEKARAEADADRRTFLAAVSHDLRTPLNAVKGFTDLLAETDLDDRQRHYIGLAQSGTERLLALIETLLELSRVEEGRVQLQQRCFDLHAAVFEQARFLQELAAEAGLSLSIRIEDAVPRWVEGDPVRLGQVIHNLLSNAIQFTERGWIDLHVDWESPQTAAVTVRDTGCGIRPEDRARLFKAFSQGQAAFRRTPGTGLGLKICRELVRLLGGEIELESEVGYGSTFRFTAVLPPRTEPGAQEDLKPPGAPAEGARSEAKDLPPVRRKEARPEPESAAPIDQVETGPTPLRVLVAEDEPANALLIQTQLELLGCQVRLAENGREAFEQWQADVPELVLLDVQMPEMDGPETARAIRDAESVRGCSRTPIAALTAHAVDAIRQTCLDAGCDAYLTKPVDRTALERLLRRVGKAGGDDPSCG